MKKAEEERLAAEAAAAAAAYEARLSIGAINEKKDESNDGSVAETPSSTKVVTLVEGPSAGWKVGPTGSILKRSMSNQTTISNSGSKSGSKRVGRK